MTRNEWNESVWAMVRMVPFGHVASYGQIAALLGQPRKARHVAKALGETPAGLEVPWYRIVNHKGFIALADRSEAALVQKARLEAEGVVVSGEGRINLRQFGWRP
ncbi:MAG: methylated-DNA--[protein]-cysteine S-methyltransferase [Acidobacteria bacterium]|nr:methylated-DNA--[protein]-cysteine S-methyltransferase [Acidobacteriota bacterium]